LTTYLEALKRREVIHFDDDNEAAEDPLKKEPKKDQGWIHRRPGESRSPETAPG
jgi:hypothetical protein